MGVCLVGMIKTQLLTLDLAKIVNVCILCYYGYMYSPNGHMTPKPDYGTSVAHSVRRLDAGPLTNWVRVSLSPEDFQA